MKSVIIFVAFACLLEGIMAAECGETACPKDMNPVCGKRIVNGYQEWKIFPNSCEMEAANDCGGGYVPC